MKYYYLNKIAMAVLVALLLFFGTRTLINIAFEEHPPEKPGFEVAGDEGHGKGEGKEEKPGGGTEIIAALQTADPAQGEKDVALCKVCHSFEKGGPTMVGPNLYGVVGHKIAGHEGFNYSDALKAKEGDWAFENMDLWLKNPQEFAAGTTMAFPGIPDLKKRADVIAYLNTNSEDPLPIPEAKPEEEAPAEAAEGDEGEAADGEDGKSEVLVLLASADAGRGEQAAALCKVCHTFDAGGATLVGPNLHNVVGAKIAAHEDFSYSDALKGKDGDWTYENLDAWLANPQAFAAGTTMAFPGIPDAQKRADVIAYLRSATENPPPLPAADAEAAPAEEEAAPAEEEEAAPAEEEAAPAEEDAAPAEEPAAEAPAEEAPAADEPEAMMEEETTEETISNPPTVSEDAPSEPSQGEPPSESQPQPVYPDEAVDDMSDDKASAEPMSAEDSGADSVGSAPDDGLSSQPQPAYPDGKPEGL